MNYCFPFHTGQLCVARGELSKASDNFKIVLDTDPNSVPALVAKVLELFCSFVLPSVLQSGFSCFKVLFFHVSFPYT